jgi:hypothetical protein
MPVNTGAGLDAKSEVSMNICHFQSPWRGTALMRSLRRWAGTQAFLRVAAFTDNLGFVRNNMALLINPKIGATRPIQHNVGPRHGSETRGEDF